MSTSSTSKVLATRLSMEEVAKARDALIEYGIAEENLLTMSDILRTCVYMTIIISDNPKVPASQESINFIKQSWNKPKARKSAAIKDLLRDKGE